MAFIQAGPVKLEYWEQGSGPRTWVLIHGFRSSSLIWDALQSHLAAAGDRSTAISMRGAGGSDETPDDEARERCEEAVNRCPKQAIKLADG